MNTTKESEVYAVRWARRELKRLFTLDYTRWHIARESNCDWTLCGRMIRVGLKGTTLPETDDDVGKADCVHCVRIFSRR